MRVRRRYPAGHRDATSRRRLPILARCTALGKLRDVLKRSFRVMSWAFPPFLGACLTLVGCASTPKCDAPSAVQYSTTRVDGGPALTCNRVTELGVTLESGYPIGTIATLPGCSQQCYCQLNNMSAVGGDWDCPL